MSRRSGTDPSELWAATHRQDGSSQLTRVASPPIGFYGRQLTLVAQQIQWEAQGRVIVDDVSFIAPAGQVTGLLGPNGAGKSSLIKVVAGITPPSGGRVAISENYGNTNRSNGSVPEFDFLLMSRRERARLMAVVEQNASTELPITVLDAVLLGRLPHRSLLSGDTDQDRAIATDALTQTGALPLQHRNFATLSGGERQRVHLARALAQQPRILILDEPTNHLDIAAQLDTLALLRELASQGCTIIAALHDLNLAATACDQIVLLSHGQVAASGTPDDVLTPAVINQVYGVHTSILHDLAGRPVLSFQRYSD